MAGYNVDIKVNANTRAAERALDKLAQQAKKLQTFELGAAGKGTRNIAEAFVPQRALTKLEKGLKGIANRANTVEKVFARIVEGVGTFGVLSAGAQGANEALKGLSTATGQAAANFSGAANKIDEFAASGDQLRSFLAQVNNSLVDVGHNIARTVVPGFAAMDDTAQASAQTVNRLQYAFQQFLDATAPIRNTVESFGTLQGASGAAALGIAAVATVAETNLLKALNDIDASSSKALKGLADDAERGVSELQRLIRATQGTVEQYENLIAKGKERLKVVNAESNEARRAANTVVRGQELLNNALKEQNDLLRQAKGLKPESEDRRATNTYNVVQRRKKFLKEEAEATRKLEQARSEAARAALAEQAANRAEAIQARADALAEETAKQKEATKAAYEASRAQDILNDKRAEAILEMARARRLAGQTMYGPEGAGPGNAAGIEAKKKIDFIKMVDSVERGLALDLHRMRLETQDQELQQELRNIEKAAKARQEAQARYRKKIPENLMLGAGFPMLFGGGGGAIAGGTLGALLPGEGFGGQIFLSAIGQKFDELAQNAIDLGQALDPVTGDINVIIEKVGVVGTKTEQYIKSLEGAGKETEAMQAATKQLEMLVGKEGVDSLKKLGDESTKMANAFQQAATIFGASVAGLIATLMKGVTDIVNRQNVMGIARGSDDPVMQDLYEQYQSKATQGLMVGAMRLGGDPAGMKDLVDQMLERARELQEIEENRLRAAQGISGEKIRTVESMEAELASLESGGDILDDQVYSLRKKEISAQYQADLAEVLRNKEWDIADVYLVQLKRKLGMAKLDNERRDAQEAADKAAGREAAAAAKKRKREQEALEKARINLGLSERILEIDRQIAAADIKGDKATVMRLERTKLIEQAAANISAIKAKDVPAAMKEVEILQTLVNLRSQLLGLQVKQDENDADKAEQFDEVIENLKLELKQAKAITQEEKDALRLEEIRKKLKESKVDLDDKQLQQIADLLAAQRRFNAEKTKEEAIQQNINSLINTAGQQLTGVLQSLVSGTNSLNDAFRGLLTTLSNSVLRYAISALAYDGPDKKQTGFFSILAGTFGGFMANGGSVTPGNSYIVGEKGPELFTPGAKGNIIPNNAMGGSNIVVNVDAGGSNVQGDGNQAKALGAAIGLAVQNEIIKQKKPGGLLY